MATPRKLGTPLRLRASLPRRREATLVMGDLARAMNASTAQDGSLVAPNGQPYDHAFIASTEQLATDGGVIQADGWRCDNYMRSGGPFIENHDLYAKNGIARTLLGQTVHAAVRSDLPANIAAPTGKALVTHVRFASTPYAQEMKSLYDGGFLRNVSVRWDQRSEEARAPFQNEIDQYGPNLHWVATRADLMELSSVILGADPGAQVVYNPAGPDDVENENGDDLSFSNDPNYGQMVLNPRMLEAFELARSNGVKLPELEKRIREIEWSQRIMVAIRQSVQDGKTSRAEIAAAVAQAIPAESADSRVHAENDKTSKTGGKLSVDGQEQEEDESDEGSDQIADSQNAPDAGAVGVTTDGVVAQVIDNQDIPSDVDVNQDDGAEGMLNDKDEPKAAKTVTKPQPGKVIVQLILDVASPRAEDGDPVLLEHLTEGTPAAVFSRLAAMVAAGRLLSVHTRAMDASAVQDALASMDQGFDALDALIAAMMPVRQQLDDSRTLIKNLLANSLETDPAVKDAIAGQPGSTKAQGDSQAPPMDGAGGLAAEKPGPQNTAPKTGSKTQQKSDAVVEGGERAAETPAFRFRLDAIVPSTPVPMLRISKDLLNGITTDGA